MSQCECHNEACGHDRHYPSFGRCYRTASRSVMLPQPNTGRSLPHFIPAEFRYCERCAVVLAAEKMRAEASAHTEKPTEAEHE